MENYWDALQERICRKCIDGDGRGNCRLPVDEVCSVKKFLPQIVATIVNVKSDSYDAYVHALRRNVCILCDWQREDGTCGRRTNLECALDRYFPLVIQVVESMNAELQATGISLSNE
jgi:hypothetical protein